ncbi:ATP-dependent zinc metalloprotease FtsH [Oxobacter pfennigii]|uniref:ATP-dependent zinc metalloprotease FtsH n=1 Tax=Oxobacter pfennigii TaxID=36849 RepID=A0A0P8YWG4_9CLOT|nr:ATP-dependent zinc metalloprotease FtsH [Oxobacter pfennigii]KPU44060.1 ATP-dependent zinc metalloprotease FtsH [Oxobacter pfennigii]
MRGRRKNKFIAITLIIIVIISLLGAGYLISRPEKNIMTYNNFLSSIESNKVETVYLSNKPELKVKMKDGSIYYTDNPRSDSLKEELLKKDVKVNEAESNSIGEKAMGFAATLILFGIIGYFLVTTTAKQRSGGIMDVTAMSKEAENNVPIGFTNVAGNEEAKESVKDIVDFLQDPDKYLKYGARMPKGVMFYGPPGTGKTLLAKAVAGEAGVPFYALSGSDFVQVYVGVGAGRIRDLFKKAREKGKCVIFIDEIDALGKKRDGGGIDGGNDEREQTLNALLAEMSGFNESQGIVVIAATNRLDTIDEALLRPGRFDRLVEVGLPDINGRHEILKIHVKGKPLSSDIDLKRLAEQAVYFSGAMLESMINEAAIFAAKRNAAAIEKADIDQAFYTVIAGAEKKDRSSLRTIDRKITAYHEAGHALIGKLIAPDNKITKVTIIPSTKGAGGYTVNIPPDRMYRTKKDMEKDIMISLGGRCAEEIIFGEENITTGASGDLERATEIVLSMVKRFGMDKDAGLLSYDVLYRNSFTSINDDILYGCKEMLNNLYSVVKKMLEENKDKLDLMANELLVKETLEEQDIESILAA